MQELMDAVVERAKGTPYQVVPTEAGFDVRLNLADAQFYGLLDKQGVKTTFVHHVKLKDEAARTFTVTDQFASLTWSAGADGRMRPSLSGRLQTVTGTVWSKGVEKEWAIRPDGSFGKVVDYSFDSREGHGLIKSAAQSVGWTEKLNGWAKGGLYAGIAGIAFAVLILPILWVVIRLNS